MVAVTSRPSYEVARRRRAELLQAIHAFERAIAGPGADPGWPALARGRLVGLRDQLAEHVVVTEGPDGLYAGLREDAPRLTRSVAGLVAEHEALLAGIDALIRRLGEPVCDVDAAREQAGDLLAALSRHRQRGADLVYEAYATDIGGET
jgi:hypothetical protein